jgi:hypothetical protein
VGFEWEVDCRRRLALRTQRPDLDAVCTRPRPDRPQRLGGPGADIDGRVGSARHATPAPRTEAVAPVASVQVNHEVVEIPAFVGSDLDRDGAFANPLFGLGKLDPGAAMLLFFVGVTVPGKSGAHRIVRAFVVLVLLYLTGVVVPWGHGENRYRLPYMVPILMFSVLGALRGRTELAQLVRPSARSAGRAAVLVTLVVLFVVLNFSRLPALLAP